MVIRVQSRAPRRADAAPESGVDLLMDRGLLRQWFIVYRLEEEIRVARRYCHPLSVVVLSPMTISSDTSPDRIRQGALAAKAAARSTDLIGWLDGDDILVVLPHTDYVGALAAIERWRDEMSAQAAPGGSLKWLAAAVQDSGEFSTARGLLMAACHRFQDPA